MYKWLPQTKNYYYYYYLVCFFLKNEMMSLGMIRLHSGAEVTELGHMQMSCCNSFTMC